MRIYRIKSIILLNAILFCLIFSACKEKEVQSDSQITTENKSEMTTIESEGSVTADFFPLNPEKVFYYLGYKDGKVLYAQCESTGLEGDTVSYWLQSAESNPLLVERRSDYFISRGYAVYQSPYICFSITVRSQDPNLYYGENILLRYDEEKKKCTEYKAKEVSDAVSCYSLGNKVFMLKRTSDSNSHSISYLEVFNPVTEDVKKYHKYSVGYSDKQDGNKEWLAACSDQNGVKGIYIKYVDSNEFTDCPVFLMDMDSDFGETASYQLDDDLKTYLLEYGAISDMVSFDNYVYIRNSSSQGCLLKIEDGKLTELFRGAEFFICRTMDDSAPLFYTWGTNQVYRINNKDVLERIDLSTAENRKIRVMFADKDSCFVECMGSDKNHTYVFSRNDLEKIALP